MDKELYGIGPWRTHHWDVPPSEWFCLHCKHRGMIEQLTDTLYRCGKCQVLCDQSGTVVSGIKIRRIAYFMDTPKGVDSFVVNRHYPIDGERATQYFEWQRRFLSTLGQDLRRCLHVRYSSTDFGHGVVGKWGTWASESREDFTGLRHRTWWKPWINGESGQRAMRRADIVICDYPGTPWLEALGMNRPTLCYFDPLLWTMRAEANHAMQKLRESGMLHDTPEDAAKWLWANQYTLEAWWERCQSVRLEFANRYCRGWNRAHRERQAHQYRRSLPSWVRIGVQHGAGYGMFASSPEEQYELAHNDLFLCWGWAEKQDYHGKCRVMNLDAIS